MLKRIMRFGFRCIAGVVAMASLIAWYYYGCQPIPKFCGTIAAQMDATRGRYKQLRYGLPFPWSAIYAQSLRKRYGVETEAVAGCDVSPFIRRYVAAYDKVSEAAVNKRFGHDVFKEVRNEAQSDWTREHR
jgi:hypothetical protein